MEVCGCDGERTRVWALQSGVSASESVNHLCSQEIHTAMLGKARVEELMQKNAKAT